MKFERAYYPEEAYDLAQYLALGLSVSEAKRCVEKMREDEVWRSDRYQVAISKASEDRSLLHLSIKRIDREPIHDWRELQQIKNALCGDEREAIEIYPAESRKVDTANQYHLWVFPEGFRIPLGFKERAVLDAAETERLNAATGMKAKQRPFDKPDLNQRHGVDQ